MITRKFSTYWVPPWDVDHHSYGAPVEVGIITRRWRFSLRPFSSFAQGGDCRGMTDFYGYERHAKWDLSDTNPDAWKHLQEIWWRHQYCRGCGHSLGAEKCAGYAWCPEGDRADRLHYWEPRYWRLRYQDGSWRPETCVRCLNDVDLCRQAFFEFHECEPARWFIFARHWWSRHLRQRLKCGYKHVEWVEIKEEDET